MGVKPGPKKADGSCCAVGRRGDVGAINAALRAGMKVREVSTLYGIGRTVVGDHRKHCLRLDDPRPKAEEGPPAPRPEPAREAPPDSEDELADSGQPVRELFEAPRARLTPHAKEAKTFTEQSLVCADMIAAGAWEGRPSTRWLSALWGLSAEAVRERHRAGAVAAQADRGAIEAERQNSIGALQEQERMALEAFEASRLGADEDEDGGGSAIGVGDPRLLAAATNARKEIARVAGCMPQAGTFAVNIYQSPEFIKATTTIVESFQGALDADAVAVLLPDVDREVVARVLNAARGLADDRMASLSGPPAIETTGEAA